MDKASHRNLIGIWGLLAVGMVVALCLALAPCRALALKDISASHPGNTRYLPVSHSKGYGYFVSDLYSWTYCIDLSKASGIRAKNLILEEEEDIGYILRPKKPGKASISYKLKGKQHTAKYVFVKYKNPMKSLKIGKKQLAKHFKRDCTWNPQKKLKGKLKVKAAKGWKLVRITHNGKKVKNGKKITYRPDDDLCLVFKNKKTKVVQRTCVGWGSDGE